LAGFSPVEGPQTTQLLTKAQPHDVSNACLLPAPLNLHVQQRAQHRALRRGCCIRCRRHRQAAQSGVPALEPLCPCGRGGRRDQVALVEQQEQGAAQFAAGVAVERLGEMQQRVAAVLF
jgi:hypothetical protein